MTTEPSAEALECAKDIREEMMRMVFMGDGELTLPAGHLSVISQHVQRFADAAYRRGIEAVRDSEPTEEMVEAAGDVFWDAWVAAKAENRERRKDPNYDGVAGSQFLPQTIRAALRALTPPQEGL